MKEEAWLPNSLRKTNVWGREDIFLIAGGKKRGKKCTAFLVEGKVCFSISTGDVQCGVMSFEKKEIEPSDRWAKRNGAKNRIHHRVSRKKGRKCIKLSGLPCRKEGKKRSLQFWGGEEKTAFCFSKERGGSETFTRKGFFTPLKGGDSQRLFSSLSTRGRGGWWEIQNWRKENCQKKGKKKQEKKKKRCSTSPIGEKRKEGREP